MSREDGLDAVNTAARCALSCVSRPSAFAKTLGGRRAVDDFLPDQPSHQHAERGFVSPRIAVPVLM